MTTDDFDPTDPNGHGPIGEHWSLINVAKWHLRRALAALDRGEVTEAKNATYAAHQTFAFHSREAQREFLASLKEQKR